MLSACSSTCTPSNTWRSPLGVVSIVYTPLFGGGFGAGSGGGGGGGGCSGFRTVPQLSPGLFSTFFAKAKLLRWQGLIRSAFDQAQLEHQLAFAHAAQQPASLAGSLRSPCG